MDKSFYIILSVNFILLVILPMSGGAPKATAKPKPKAKIVKPIPSLKQLAARLAKTEILVKNAKRQAYRAKKYARDLSKKMTILEKLRKIPAVQGTFSDQKPCPVKLLGFSYSPEFKSCFYLSPSVIMANWTEAEATCQRRHKDAHLVSIDSASKQRFLKHKWTNERGVGNVMRYWTSGTMKNGDWNWSGINKPVKYHNWIPLTAHSNPNLACLSVFSNEGYYWGDVPCSSYHMITCEMRLP